MLFSYRLPGALPDEKIIKIVRKDFFIVVRKIFLFLLLAVIPLFFYFLIGPNSVLFNNITMHPVLIMGTSAFYLFLWLFFFFSFLDYYLDFWVITSYRIIDIKQDGFFSRTISEQSLDKLQDITSETKGFWATIFRYGNVYVQTAGEIERFTFFEVSDPDIIRDLIIKMAKDKK